MGSTIRYKSKGHQCIALPVAFIISVVLVVSGYALFCLAILNSLYLDKTNSAAFKVSVA